MLFFTGCVLMTCPSRNTLYPRLKLKSACQASIRIVRHQASRAKRGERSTRPLLKKQRPAVTKLYLYKVEARVGLANMYSNSRGGERSEASEAPASFRKPTAPQDRDRKKKSRSWTATCVGLSRVQSNSRALGEPSEARRARHPLPCQEPAARCPNNRMVTSDRYALDMRGGAG